MAGSSGWVWQWGAFRLWESGGSCSGDNGRGWGNGGRFRSHKRWGGWAVFMLYWSWLGSRLGSRLSIDSTGSERAKGDIISDGQAWLLSVGRGIFA